MAIKKKTPEDIAVLREAGHILASILKRLGEASVPGTTTLDLDDLAMELVEEYGVEPILLGYHPSFAPTPYPAAICISVNECVQHGIPSADIVLKEGDVVNLDMSIGYQGLVVDSGITVGVGEISSEASSLLCLFFQLLFSFSRYDRLKTCNHIRIRMWPNY